MHFRNIYFIANFFFFDRNFRGAKIKHYFPLICTKTIYKRKVSPRKYSRTYVWWKHINYILFVSAAFIVAFSLTPKGLEVQTFRFILLLLHKSFPPLRCLITRNTGTFSRSTFMLLNWIFYIDIFKGHIAPKALRCIHVWYGIDNIDWKRQHVFCRSNFCQFSIFVF